MDSYKLIISEKPQAAMRIAEALAEGKIRKVGDRAYWLEFFRKNEKHVVVPAVGHLFVLDTEKGGGWNYPVFKVQWVPTFTKKGSEFTKKYYENIKRLVKNANDFIIATDFDIEGEVIGYNIIRFLCEKDDAKRMKFSTLTKHDLVEAYENVMNHLVFSQVEAGLTRHYLDFYWGINTTRALTLALKSVNKGFYILSSGRVQSPILKLLLDRELEIRKFVPTPFWQIELYCLLDGKILKAVYEKDRIWKKEEAESILKDCKNKDATVEEIKRRKYKVLPPTPFDTTTLQAEAYRCFGFSPAQTLAIAEALYNQALISYPRTASQKLPPKINYKKILQGLSKVKKYKEFSEELLSKETLKPREGKKSDPAHVAIYPTGEFPKGLTSRQERVYRLIVKRFLSLFGDPASRESMRIKLKVDKHTFISSGAKTVEPGWMKYYEEFVKLKEETLPELKEGQVLRVKDLKLLTKETEPPNRYSQASILKEMEKRGLGTKATRAEILQTLYDRKYIMGKSIKVTKLGETVGKILEEFCPRILSEELTRHFEREMDLVYNGKKKREEVIEEAKKVLVEILQDFKQNENKIGEKLMEGLKASREEERRLGVCPKCGGELRIIRSRRTGLFFVGCSNYPKCTNSYPLPQHARIEKTGKVCDKCGTPIIRVYRKGKRPFTMCLDPNCPTKKDWNKKNYKKKTSSSK